MAVYEIICDILAYKLSHEAVFLLYSNCSLSRVRNAILIKIITKKLQRVNCHVYHNGITENIYSLEENEIARIMRYQLFCYQQMAVNNCLTLVLSCIFITLVPWFISLYFSMIYVVRSLHHFLTTCSRVCGCGTKFARVLPRPRGARIVTVVFYLP